MKNKKFEKLLLNKDKIHLRASTKWARDLQVEQIPLESYFGDMINHLRGQQAEKIPF